MKPRNTISAIVLADTLPAMALGGVALAETATKTTSNQTNVAQSAQQDQAETSVLKTQEEALKAVRDVHAARLAIFDGAPEKAASLAASAQRNLEKAQSDGKDFAVDTAKSKGGDMYVPFDTSIGLAEGFVPTDEKTAKIGEANKQLANGDQKKAIETLKLADVDLTFSAAMLPANASLGHVQDAVKLIGDGKYYEANLALKAVEDSVLVESYGIEAVPAQGQNRHSENKASDSKDATAKAPSNQAERTAMPSSGNQNDTKGGAGMKQHKG